MNTHDVNSWGKFTTWQSVTPPSRPDKWQLQRCRFICQHVSRKKNVAVLGSTIEFRELLSNMGFLNVFVFDRNREFFDYITPFANRTLDERFVDGNWLDSLRSCEKMFDVILSDLTSGNIAYEDREAFYSSISNALTPDGLYIDRILTKPIPFIDLKKLLSKYSSTEINNQTVNSFNCEVMFCSSLLENKDQIVDTDKFYDKLLLYDMQRINEFVTKCYEITPRKCIWWYSKDWELERAVFEKYLKILEVFDEPVRSEYYRRAKLIISRKRGAIR